MGRICLRLGSILFPASLLPVLAFGVSMSVFGAGYAVSLGLAAGLAMIVAVLSTRAVLYGLGRPVVKLSAKVRAFMEADHKFENVIPKEGWPEAAGLISALNRLMLELNAYRAFHLNQVVEERAKAEALIETISDGVLLAGDRGQLIYSNRQALNILGIPVTEQNITLPGSVKQKDFYSVLSGIISSQEDYLKAEVEVQVPEDPLLSRRGKPDPLPAVKSFRVISRRFLLATLKKPGRVIVLRDVTMEKEIESARETVFHMITHDMRAPLCSIQGYAQLMRNALPGSPEAEKCVSAILRSSARLNGMIGDILNTIKLERGDIKLNPVPVDAGNLCLCVFEAHEPLAARKDIRFSFALPPGKIGFNGDAVLLERVLSNLVGNSLKFAAPGGSVSLSCREACGEVLFQVEDNGPGIPKEKQKDIFEKYAQLEEHKYMGFGLGLAMCRMAVELHKGRIWVESEEGSGSKFSFAIPLK
ncbi:MAG TPA: hypothetical protein DCZ93_02815 [Elusimicrobia bacterium]|nr:hypothetical protein [Elusimicrobiota bacterium]